MIIHDHGLLHLLKGPGAVANSLTSIKNALAKCLFIFNHSSTH